MRLCDWIREEFVWPSFSEPSQTRCLPTSDLSDSIIACFSMQSPLHILKGLPLPLAWNLRLRWIGPFRKLTQWLVNTTVRVGPWASWTLKHSGVGLEIRALWESFQPSSRTSSRCVMSENPALRVTQKRN